MEKEIVEATTTLMDAERALVVGEPRGGAELQRFMPVMSMEQAVERRKVIVSATQDLMREDVDYGVIPGTQRSTLLQPGADKLGNLFGLMVEYTITAQVQDWTGDHHDGEPFFYTEFAGEAKRGGHVVGHGIGSCNSWESKYRWREAKRTCPACQEATIFKSRDGGWFCWAKKGGCGAKFADGNHDIEGQQIGRIPNPDVCDQVNTIQKMALKRCKISTIINATSASEFFTQDMEDFSNGKEQGQVIDTNGHTPGTQAAASAVRNRKLGLDGKPPPPYQGTDGDQDLTGELQASIQAERDKKVAQYQAAGASPKEAARLADEPSSGLSGPKTGPAPVPPNGKTPWASGTGMTKAFAEIREALKNDDVYFGELNRAGVEDPTGFRSMEKARNCYRQLRKMLEESQGVA